MSSVHTTGSSHCDHNEHEHEQSGLSLNTTQEMEMMVVILSTCRYPFTLHSPENLPIVII